MFFSLELKFIQALLVIAGDVFECDSEKLFVDEPLIDQLNINPLDMTKFTLAIDSRLGMVKPLSLRREMTFIQMAHVLSGKQEVCLKTA
jgi:hypothetical protein